MYVDSLKPTYNSVDLTEVELPDVESNFNHHGHPKEDEDSNMLMIVSIICDCLAQREAHCVDNVRPGGKHWFKLCRGTGI